MFRAFCRVPSGLNVNFEYIDAYVVKKPASGVPPGAPAGGRTSPGRTTSRTPILRHGTKYVPSMQLFKSLATSILRM